MKAEIKSTTNYDLFVTDPTNRPIGKRPKLEESMKQYGFNPAYPLHVVRRGGRLVILDGQHRFANAKSLGLPVYYVLCADDGFDVAKGNGAQKQWSLSDFAASYSARGDEHYVKLLDYCHRNAIGIRAAASMMIGESAEQSRASLHVKEGTFQIKTMTTANAVAKISNATAELVDFGRHQSYIAALSRMVRLTEFDGEGYVAKIKRSPFLLTRQPSIDGFLQMIEDAMNWRSPKKMAFVFMAKEAAKERAAAGLATAHASRRR